MFVATNKKKVVTQALIIINALAFWSLLVIHGILEKFKTKNFKLIFTLPPNNYLK
jgi:hypothetical protein